jgi:hypothetical protein
MRGSPNESEAHTLRGATDRPALLTIRDTIEEMEPLATAELDEYLNPSILTVALDDGLCEADDARFDIQWTTENDYTFHYSNPPVFTKTFTTSMPENVRRPHQSVEHVRRVLVACDVVCRIDARCPKLIVARGPTTLAVVQRHGVVEILQGCLPGLTLRGDSRVNVLGDPPVVLLPESDLSVVELPVLGRTGHLA